MVHILLLVHLTSLLGSHDSPGSSTFQTMMSRTTQSRAYQDVKAIHRHIHSLLPEPQRRQGSNHLGLGLHATSLTSHASLQRPKIWIAGALKTYHPGRRSIQAHQTEVQLGARSTSSPSKVVRPINGADRELLEDKWSQPVPLQYAGLHLFQLTMTMTPPT
jgi:hypothetical protein